MNEKELSSKTVAELKKLAQDLKITGISSKTKPALIELILKSQVSAIRIEEKPIAKAEELKPEIKAQISAAEPKVELKQEIKAENTNTEVIKPNDSAKIQTENTVKEENTPIVSQSQQQRPNPNQNSNNNQQRNFQQRPNNSNHISGQKMIQPHSNGQNHNNNQNQNFRDSQSNQQVNKPTSQQANSFTNEATVEITGVLEIMSDGTHGVLRTPKLIPSDKDTYISISQVKKLKLRKGDVIVGTARLPKENERYYSLLWIKTVNGTEIDKLRDRVHFDELKPVYPNKQIKLEIGQFPVSNRIIDLLAPIGFGQRAMIVAPPKAGKTTLLKDIAKGINENNPEVTLMVVLIGERPEEVTDIERSVNGIVYSSNFDDSPANQVAVAELSLERAKRMVELGQDVIILMDSLTRLARAYNLALPASGRTLSGGLDPVSLYPSKRFFGAARNFENGASLTIVATSLVETGSKMDDVIFEEFKGTGNMELKLDRRMERKRIFPAINFLESSTRNEELLLGTEQLHNSWKIRRMLETLGDDGNEALIDRMKSTKSNEDFLNALHQY